MSRVVPLAGAPSAAEPVMAAVGARVRLARQDQGLSRQALSNMSGVSPRYLAQLEAGAGNISIALLARVATALNKPLGWLVEGTEAGVQSLFLQADPATQDRVMNLLRGAALRQTKANRICLIGLRGAGKSTLGKGLGAALDLPFVELNAVIEQIGGMALSELMALVGTDGYRELEARALRETLDRHPAVVLAVAGGLVAEPETYDMLRQTCHTVWVRTSPAEHMDRVRKQGDTRPMAGNPQAMTQLQSLLDRRAPLYAQADAQLETSGQTVETSLTDLRRLVERYGFLSPA